MFTLAFWRAASERAVKSFAGALLMLWVGGPAGLVNLWAVDLRESLGFACGMAVVSVLMSLVSLPIASNGGPSLGGETLTSRVAAEQLPGGAVVAGPAARPAEGTPVVVTPSVPVAPAEEV